MDEIYVLISGAYSDWNIEGFVNTEEEAIKTCLKENEKIHKNHNGDTWYDFYYARVEKFNSGNLNNIKPIYNYRVIAWGKENNWTFEDKESINISYEDAFKYKPEIEMLKARDSSYHDTASIKFSLNELNRNKALKIAQDMLYKKLAEDEEI